MKHYIWVEVKTKNQSRVLLKLFKQKIDVLEIKYTKESLQFKIEDQDKKKLKKIVGYKFHKIHEDGIFAGLSYIKKKYLIAIGIIFFCLFIFFFSNIIVSVNVIHSNKEIRELVTKALDNYGIKRLTLKKDFQELEQIKEQILNDYPNELEWLEIEVSGMKYIVRIEERIITKEENKKERCHLIATKSGIVKKILYSLGDAKVAVNDYVEEGDILISGELIANEEIKGEVCATGSVYGEVWYTTKISLPLTYEEKKETGKTRWNFAWNRGGTDNYILRPRLKDYIDEKKSLFNILDTNFSFIKQKEVQIEEKKYTEEEALEKAFALVDEKFKMKLSQKEEILDKKVLKKQVNNSTMDIEVFVSVLENISRQEEFQKTEEKEG